MARCVFLTPSSEGAFFAIAVIIFLPIRLCIDDVLKPIYFGIALPLYGVGAIHNKIGIYFLEMRYKLMNLVISMYSSKYQEDNDNFDYFKCITWSPYERIDVKPVTSFKELCKGGAPQTSDQSKVQTWTGVKQCLHLIGIDGKGNGFSLTEGNSGDCVFNLSDEQNKHSFFRSLA